MKHVQQITMFAIRVNQGNENPIRRCAQKLELHGADTIIPHIEAELLCFCMFHQTVHFLQHIWLDEGLEIWYILNHVRDHWHIVEIHV